MSTKNEIGKSEETKAKEQIYYSALLNAWINSKNEKDKQIITLSSLGIGFTISIMTAIKDNFSIYVLAGGILIMAIFCYTILLGLRIIGHNSDYINSILKKEEENTQKIEQLLKEEDQRYNKSFKTALVVLCLLGAILGITFLTGGKMKEQEQTENRPPNNGQNRAIESLQGLNQLSPEKLNLSNTAKDSPTIVPQSTNNDSVPKISDQNNSTVNKEEK